MTIAQVWGCLIIFLGCPILGAIPLISWVTYAITGRQLALLGTGNISVSAAFYHGGKLVGILAVLSEAFKGIVAVLLARSFFPSEPVWELIALIFLVIGRYSMGKGAGTTNVVWGIVIHDPISAGLIFLIGGISFRIFRDRTFNKIFILILAIAILTLRHWQEPKQIIAAIALFGLLAWITLRIPDDLNLLEQEVQADSQQMFRFLRGNKKILSLNHKLDPSQVGQKAANLSQLKEWGYSVPDGWVLLPKEDLQPLIEFLQPSQTEPLIVRSSAIGEDSESASGAGQYATILNITDKEQLKKAIIECRDSYNSSHATQYRLDRNQKAGSITVLIQKQVKGVFSGVAFSRDPLDRLSSAVVIEALPGDATQVVSGQVTPQQYKVYLTELEIEGNQDNTPPELIKNVALLTREIEELYHDIPQDIEWTYDGEQLWLLQTRPITTLLPIWTRKIASEVIPGLIRPLTWSINRPLTCGVWGEIFTIVLGDRAVGLNFEETATLHYSRAYFNATLLGDIFCRMGLPRESLEFLTRGAKFSKPPLKSTLSNLSGLLKLLRREWNLEKDFYLDLEDYFTPTLNQLNSQSPSKLSPQELLERIETILSVLKKATYYSILAPLSLALRQAIFKISETELDNSQTPEIASMRSLALLAEDIRNSPPDDTIASEKFEKWLESYGYLSEVATDISVTRWQEDPKAIKELFTQLLLDDQKRNQIKSCQNIESKNWKTKLVQRRLTLKGKVTEIYSKLLAHLRFSFIALEETWLKSGDIFFLNYSEIQRLIKEQLPYLIHQRQIEFEQHQKITAVPYIIYGNPSPSDSFPLSSPLSVKQKLQGIGASPGCIEGKIKILHNFKELPQIDRQIILVVPYTDSGWAPLLASAGGLIAEVGGRLSHGAIVAREYGIPAVMDVHNATQLLQDGQKVRLDGQRGAIEILED
jgi:phosphoenolpyruvate synthase/pyruvate phosphate dikinase/glycerol-3-phosphate acyltransferase PlsY